MKKRKKIYIPDYVFLVICVAPLLVIYVLIYHKIYQIGYKIDLVEKKYEELNFINRTYKAELLKLTSLDSLKQLSQKFNLSLTTPDKWCYLDIKKINGEKEKISDEVYAETK